MNGSRLIAGCFRFIFGSRYAESTRSKFGVSAYSRINTVTENIDLLSVIFYSPLIQNSAGISSIKLHELHMTIRALKQTKTNLEQFHFKQSYK